MSNATIAVIGMFAWIAAYFVSQGELDDAKKEIKELKGLITTPRQFEMESETYRCYHFPEFKEKELER